MKYILCFKAKRKNAKRHIQGRYNSIEECEKYAINSHYKYYILNGKWELIKEL